MQGLLESLPGHRPAQHLAGIQDQVAAVGPVQGARPDQMEVGQERAHLGAMLDTTEQAIVVRVLLEDHRRAAEIAVVDDQVHPVFAEQGEAVLRLGGGAVGARALGGCDDRLDVLDDVLAQVVEVGENVGQVTVAGLQGIDQMADRVAGRLVVQLAQPVPGFADPDRRLPEGLLELFLQGLDLALDRLPGRRVEFLKGLGRNDLTVMDRREGEAHGRAQQRDAMVLGPPPRSH